MGTRSPHSVLSQRSTVEPRGDFPTLELDSELGAFVRRQNKHEAFARLFGVASGSEHLGRYRLLRLIGQGGMGVVYLALDETLDREVALKLVRTGVGGRDRLLREGQAMARLTHPNVVRVYEVGEAETPDEGGGAIAFIAMEYVDGVTLDEWLRQQPRSRTEILTTSLAAGRGLAAAHEAGLVHRDFKPQNVLVHRDGRVLVTDFGLAREGADEVMDSSPDHGSSTETAVAGTPAYMAPEGLRGLEPRPASDQYSFCVTLWEALYGAHPHPGRSLDELAEPALPEPEPPAKARLPRRLHELLVRGLAADPGARWASMTTLLDELEACITARRRWLRLGALAAVLALALAVLVLVLALQQRDALLVDKDEDLAVANVALERELELSHQKQQVAEDALSRQRGLRAEALIPEDREGEALLLAVQAVGAYGPQWSRPPPPEARAALEAVLVDDARVIEPVARLTGGQEQISHVAVSLDGARVAAIDRVGVVRVWDLATGRILATGRGHEGIGLCVDFSPDGEHLVSSGKDGRVRVWDLAQGTVHELDGHEGEVVWVRFSPRGDVLASVSLDGTGRLWDSSSGSLRATLDGHRDFVTGVQFTPDGHRVATHSYDGSAKIWDVQTGSLQASFVGHEDVVRDMRFTPDGEQLVTISHDGTTRMWDAASGVLDTILERQPSHIYALAVSPDGSQLATGGRAGELRVWSLDSRRLQASFPASPRGVRFVRFSTDGRGLASHSYDEPLRFWDLDANRLEAVSAFDVHDGGIAAFPRDDRVATTGDDGSVSIWDPRVDEPLVRVAGHHAQVDHLAFRPDGAQLSTAAADGVVKLWQPDTGELQATLTGHVGQVLSMRYSPNGAQLATGGEDHDIMLWDSSSGQRQATLHGHGNYVLALAYAPSGRWLASTSLDDSLRIWDLDEGTLRLEARAEGDDRRFGLEFSLDGRHLVIAGRSLQVWDAERFERRCVVDEVRASFFLRVSLSPDGRQFAYQAANGDIELRASDDCGPVASFSGQAGVAWAMAYDGAHLAVASDELRVWDARTSTLLYSLPNKGRVHDLELSPDGSQLAMSSDDHRVEVRDLASGELRFSLENDEHFVRELAYSPNGRSLALGGTDGRPTLRDASTGELMMTFADRVVLRREDGSELWPVPTPALLRIGCERLASFDEFGAASELCRSSP